MTVSKGAYLKGLYNSAKALGDKAISSDATMQIEGYEHMTLLIKQFPWPTLSPAGEIEVALPLGGAMWQPQQIKTNQQGQITFVETVKGHVAAFLQQVQANGGIFNAKVFEGTPEKHSRVERIYECFIQLDNPDRDHENRAQVLTVSGTLFFNYFGTEEG